MAIKQIEGPLLEPVSLKQAIRHLNEYEEPVEETPEEPVEETPEEPVEETPEESEDTYNTEDHIADLISTAREACEEYQNRAYLTQTWELWLDSWPAIIEVPRPPLQEVISIKWYDTENVEHTIDTSDYFVDTNSEPGRILSSAGKSWPTELRAASGICITYKAGNLEVAKVPRRVKQAILLLVAEWYLNREASSLTGKDGVEKYNREIPFGVSRLLNYDRVVPV